MHARLLIIMRYVCGDIICEKIYGFNNVTYVKTGTWLTDVIEIVLKYFSNTMGELVSQAYGCRTAIAVMLRRAQKKLRNKWFKPACLNHWYLYKLNLFWVKILRRLVKSKCFFFICYLRAFMKFTSSKTLVYQFRVSTPSIGETRWCYTSRIVSPIKLLYEKLKSAFTYILSSNENRLSIGKIEWF